MNPRLFSVPLKVIFEFYNLKLRVLFWSVFVKTNEFQMETWCVVKMGINMLSSKWYSLPFILKPILMSLKRSEISNMKELIKETTGTHFSRRREPQHYTHSRSSRDYWTQMSTTSQMGIIVMTFRDYNAICERNVRDWNRRGLGHSMVTPAKCEIVALIAAMLFLCSRRGSVPVGIECSWW